MEKVEGASKLFFEAWKCFYSPTEIQPQRFVRVDFGVPQPKTQVPHSSASEGFVGRDVLPGSSRCLPSEYDIFASLLRR